MLIIKTCLLDLPQLALLVYFPKTNYSFRIVIPRLTYLVIRHFVVVDFHELVVSGLLAPLLLFILFRVASLTHHHLIEHLPPILLLLEQIVLLIWLVLRGQGLECRALIMVHMLLLNLLKLLELTIFALARIKYILERNGSLGP